MPPSDEDKGFSVLVSCTLQNGKVDEYLSHLRDVVEHLSQEPEFLHIEVMRPRESPDKLKYIEHWAKSPEWFVENIASKAYVREYVKATDPLLVEKRTMEAMDRCGGPWARTRDGNFIMM